MRQVSVNSVDSTVTAQGGALWKDMNDTAAMFNLAVVSGTVSQVGVGGLTMRGGYGYLTPRYGLVLDKLLSAKVITGDGQILNASPNEHSDLFWAIRGARANVGVAAVLRFQAHAQANMVWCGTMMFARDKLTEVIQALNGCLVHPQENAAAQCVLALSPDSGAPVITIVLFFNSSQEEGRTHFSSLINLECISTSMEMRPYAQANTMLDDVMPPGGRKEMLGVKLVPPILPEFASELLEEVGRKLIAVPELARSCFAVDYFDLSKVYSVPINETAFPSRTKTLNGVLILQWVDPSKDKDFIAWGKEIQNMCEAELQRASHKPDKLVSTFSGYTQDDNLTPEDMFGVNADALLKVKRKYDPDNVFNKLNPLELSG
ncbi:Disease resistance protein [Penicillium cf. griseofulvum]|nr:Disease resistance protein [Penicillium cf. griseofulvum]